MLHLNWSRDKLQASPSFSPVFRASSLDRSTSRFLITSDPMNHDRDYRIGPVTSHRSPTMDPGKPLQTLGFVVPSGRDVARTRPVDNLETASTSSGGSLAIRGMQNEDFWIKKEFQKNFQKIPKFVGRE